MVRRFIILVSSVLLLGVPCVNGEDYVRISSDGTLTNIKDTKEIKVLVRPSVEKKEREILDYDSLVVCCSERYGLPPSLVKAVIHAESNWDPLAVSRKGAMGLMQLMPETARMLGVTDPFDPVQNVDGGTRYLAELVDAFNGRLHLALAAYNAGPTVVSSLGRVPQNRETPQYVSKVISVYRAQGGEVSEVGETVVEREKKEKPKKPFVASEMVFLCEDERGGALITNVPVLRGG